MILLWPFALGGLNSGNLGGDLMKDSSTVSSQKWETIKRPALLEGQYCP